MLLFVTVSLKNLVEELRSCGVRGGTIHPFVFLGVFCAFGWLLPPSPLHVAGVKVFYSAWFMPWKTLITTRVERGDNVTKVSFCSCESLFSSALSSSWVSISTSMGI